MLAFLILRWKILFNSDFKYIVLRRLIIDLLRVKLASIHAIFHRLIGEVKKRRKKKQNWREDKWENIHATPFMRKRKQNWNFFVSIRKDLEAIKKSRNPQQIHWIYFRIFYIFFTI